MSASVPRRPLDTIDLMNSPETWPTSHYFSIASGRCRRSSSISYQNSGARDSSYSRNPRNLVVVIPPPDVPLRQEHLGHVLSTGPCHRLSQGILMPLFPSMFGQLNAIAREYNFPSTLGLCLYLHVNENGITITPRISDDSWQYLFGHLFDTHTRPHSGAQRLPIAGRIEFDIDLNKARWFDAWLSATLSSRDSNLSPPVVPCGREEGLLAEDRRDASGSHMLVPNSGPRHLPKTLSLVDRRESQGLHVPPRLQHHLDPPVSPRTYALSTIPQSPNPQVSKNDLEHRINSWRATTESCPVSMTDPYHQAPDVGVTSTDERHAFTQQVGIGECHWSVTSGVPRSPVMNSPIVSSRPSSVRLDRRANGSIPPTPITVTSWGPTDDEWYSVVSNASRLPSPDIGERMIEDSMTPRHPAVWGNFFGWRSASTWKEVYPYATKTKSIAVQPRDSDDLPLSVWGSSFGWQKAVTWQMVYPYSTTTMQSVAPIQLSGARAGGLVSKYPNLCIYPATYPHFEIYPACIAEEDISRPVSVLLNDLATRYPTLVIYPAVYPHFDIYPPVVAGVKTKGSSLLDTVTSTGVSTLYPNLFIYPLAYPHVDLYLKALQIGETLTHEINVKLRNVGGLTVLYPNMIIYPSVYPYLDIYPTQDMLGTSSLVWPISVHLGQQSNSSSNYPHLSIYPVVYPNFDLYSPCPAIVETEGFQTTKNDQCTINLIPHYPNLVIYPAVYPHIDVYPSFARVLVAVTGEKAQSNLRRRRIEMWRAKAAAQVGLAEPLANNHVWETDEPLQIYLADYAWSQTSAETPTSSVEFASTLSISGSVHSDLRIEGSVSLSPPTATTWGPQDDDWCSDKASIERLPPSDLGQRVLDDVENVDSKFALEAWHLGRPFVECPSQMRQDLPSVLEESVSVLDYPHQVIYPAAYPHFDLYPAWANIPPLKNEVTELFANSKRYLVFDIYPTIYPCFNIYPAINLRAKVPNRTEMDANVCHKPVEMRLPSLYPTFDIYHACYPCNLDYIYPSINVLESLETPIEPCRGYPWLVIYPPVYPFILPYPGFLAEVNQPLKPQQPLAPVSLPELKPVSIQLPVRYPAMVIYPASYPWSLESIYPAVSVDDSPAVIESQYLCIRTHHTTHPFVQPAISDPVDVLGTLEEDEYVSAKDTVIQSVVYPYFDLYPASGQERVVRDESVDYPETPPPTTTRRNRMTHVGLHASIFPYLGSEKQTHLQLRTNVFKEGVTWTPSGHTKDTTSERQDSDMPIPKSERLHPQGNPRSLAPRSTQLGALTIQSPPVVLPVGQPISRSPSPAVSETTNASTHQRATSSRLSHTVKSMIPGEQWRRLSAPPASRHPQEHDDHQHSTRLLSIVDRWQTVVLSPPHTSACDFTPRYSQWKKTPVLPRESAYEQLLIAMHPSSTKVQHHPAHNPTIIQSIVARAGVNVSDPRG